MSKQIFRAVDITYVAMFAALMAIGANATSLITIGTVPLTLQTFFAILAGALLGSRLGSLSMVVYTLIGLVGAPVFAQLTGTAILTKPTFGFVISFIVLAYVSGKIVETKTKPTLKTFFIACFIGLIINYVIGTTYLYFSLKYFLGSMENLSYIEAWKMMLLFIYKDIILTFIAAILCPKVYSAVNKNAKFQTNTAA